MKYSAGIALYRRSPHVEVLLGHMGGPFWARKHERAWTIPKGEYDVGDDELTTARREFVEETGHPVPDGDVIDLGAFEQSRQKIIRVWALCGDLDAATCVSNTFEMEWPPRSGTTTEFPEIDRFGWFDLATAASLVVAGQVPVLDAVADISTL